MLDDALWAFRTVYRTSTGKQRQWQLNDLDEWHQQAYGNSFIYKEQTKKWHDKRLRGSKEFQVGDRVLLHNSCLRLFPGKLRSCWSGPFMIQQVFPYGTVELHHPNKGSFKMNGHRLKHYHGDSLEVEERVNMLLF
ncbi:uncharacterized protein LOC125369841 [Ricinus communis]|uniref:uncharacterized protein LOC125369841 n=1 Tax=Ricinus communis TaxID=3988 RepID=UPI00201A8AFB|nr:uncharacterized protein LOC125369841 [Ricinus communis]